MSQALTTSTRSKQEKLSGRRQHGSLAEEFVLFRPTVYCQLAYMPSRSISMILKSCDDLIFFQDLVELNLKSNLKFLTGLNHKHIDHDFKITQSNHPTAWCQEMFLKHHSCKSWSKTVGIYPSIRCEIVRVNGDELVSSWRVMLAVGQKQDCLFLLTDDPPSNCRRVCICTADQ